MARVPLKCRDLMPAIMLGPTGTNPDGCQVGPHEVMMDSVICLLQIHGAGIEGLLGDAGCINEVVQGEGDRLDWRGLPEVGCTTGALHTNYQAAFSK